MSDEAPEVEVVEADPKSVIYNSQPIMNLFVGDYQFVNGVLRLTPEDAETFDALMASMPLVERNRVTKIDHERANELIAAIVPVATQNPDSSAGRAALLELQAKQPKLGTKPVDTETKTDA